MDEKTKKKLQQCEGIFDRIHETYLRNKMILDDNKKINDTIDKFKMTLEVFYEESKNTNVEMSNYMNDLLDIVVIIGQQLLYS